MNKEELRKKLKLLTFADFVRLVCGVLLFILLVTVITRSRAEWWLAFAFSAVLFAVYLLNSVLVKKYVWKSLLYALEYVLLLLFSLRFPNNFLSTAYSVILVDFYMNNTFKSNCVFGGLSYVAYAASIITAYVIENGDFVLYDALTSVANELTIFTLVFTIANMLSAIIKRNRRIEENLRELAERERRLQEAQESLKEVTRLEERNRIAKEIHDTTGHSITTIIMLTEAAKLQIDTAPEEAKNRIISANIQAVKALEELRRSVRVLSGEHLPFDLAANIAKTISETTEGTGIAVRSKYPDAIDIDEDIALFIYGSLKEGLNNGIRHGRATAFLFELKIADGEIKFLLSDNGTGSDSEKPGFGLRTMKENAEKLGGSAEFVSSPGEGFEIRMTIPCRVTKGDEND